jgi:cardiolipin synthase A/B
MFDGGDLTHWLTLHGLVTLVAVLLYVVTARVLHQRRHPSAAIAWMLFIVLLPYVALPAFLSFGSRKLQRPRPTEAIASNPAAPRAGDDWAVETLAALGQPAPAAYHAFNLHRDGTDAQQALLDTLGGARVSIEICTFILGRDALGSTVLARLCDKARSGVRVRLLLDGLGRWMGGRPDLAPLAAAGGQVALFVPPLRSPLKGRFNLRNHRKLVVADAGQADARLWCGGRNLAHEYFGGAPGEPPWRDLSFDLQGPLVQQAAEMFERDWAFARGHKQPSPAWPATVPASSVSSAAPWPAPAAHGAQLVASGPDQVDDTIYALLLTAAHRARRRIVLVTPYFVPEPALLMALCMAARRGVVVDLLLPERSNHHLSDLARSRAARALAQAGGRVWLAPGMLHAKLVVVDDSLALAGSANLDSRSLFLNYELMFAFHHPADVQRFADWFDVERAPARRYVAEAPGLVRDLAEGMLLWAAFQL